MSIPHIGITKQDYIDSMKAGYLELAQRHHELGQNLSMWQHLFNWVQCEEIYGAHWDKLMEKPNELS